MKVKDAINKFLEKFPDKKIIEGYEYDSIFVFSAVSQETEVGDEPFFDCQFSVNKETGKISTFKPFFITIDEYKNGKKLF